MITSAQQDYIEDHAYVPEHLPEYVTAISRTEPFLFGDFLVYKGENHLIFIGHPLKERFDEKRMGRVLEEVIRHFKPESVSVTAPALPTSLKNCTHSRSDCCYRLKLSSPCISQKLRNMLNRAGRELVIEKNRGFDKDHRRIVEEFLESHPVGEETRFIFRRIDQYLSTSKTARIFNARKQSGELVAFDIGEFRPKDYAFYMFNFSSDTRYVPGASDLLLSEVIQEAKNEGKRYVNLGLGINPGVTFFKKKWGGVLFFPNADWLYRPSGREFLESLFQKL